jgi:rhodanese-related sulfurtransferase
MAENLIHTGIKVTLYQRGSQVLAPIDEDMAKLVHTHLRRNGVDLRLNAREPDLNADFVIVATGVSPDSRLAKAAGLAVNAKGGILVDEHMRTEDGRIYAVGDAVEISDFVTGRRAMYALAGPANKQARIAADNICGIPSVYRGAQASSILRIFGMTVASTGVNEKTAKRLGLRYDKVFTHSASHASYFPGADTLTLKTLFDTDSGKILGAQIVGGDGADKRCDVLATAIRADMTAYDLTELDLCYAPPYSSAKDPVNMAGYVIENLLTARTQQFHWHDVDALLRDESVTLLDTRTPAEYAAGHIDRFVNIPLDELRERLGELAGRKPVYLTCQVGMRGYLACRILVQNGFEAYNLSGGYRLYEEIMQDGKVGAKST